MTKYTVVWHSGARDDVATIWLDNESKRNLITSAAHLIDLVLKYDAEKKGVPIGGITDLSIVGIKPISAIVKVIESDRVARVTHLYCEE